MTKDEVEVLARCVQKMATEMFQPIVNELARRINDLGDAVKSIEGRGLKYSGVHQRALAYGRGDVVTYQGSLWIALRATDSTPGENNHDWQLAVRCGRDGKDAR